MRPLSALLILLTLCACASASGRGLTFTAGAFKFNATDYYYPIFYDEAGFRGAFDFAPSSVQAHNLRLQFYVYPGDDNIFETIVEYGYVFDMPFKEAVFEVMPAAGVAMTKFQYPLPYYLHVEHVYSRWLRAGADVKVGHNFMGPSSLSAGYAFRALYYDASRIAAFDAAQGGEPLRYVHSPFGEFRYALNDAWALVGRGGVEWGGYYDAVFMNTEEKARPFGEVGFAHAW